VNADVKEMRLHAREIIAEGVVLLDLRDPRGAPVPAWEPGAHIDLIMGDVVRQYSLCGDPADRSRHLVAVLREPGGRGGSLLAHGLAPGATVGVRGPRNHFPLVPAGRYLFLAGGIGITPLVPMLAAVTARGASWRLVYGGRSEASMAFRADLTSRYGPRVAIRAGGLIDLDAELDTPLPDTAVYCCGPEPMLAAVEEACSSWPPGALHIERFTPRSVPEPEPRSAFEVELSASGRTLSVPADRSLLAVLEQAGVQVMTSCEEGTCGTCETRVLDGVPDHRDSVLSEAERASGTSILVCVSRARTPRLVLDL
jgi:ferredoxin-NADP reductase